MYKCIVLLLSAIFINLATKAQSNYKPIPLPPNINGVNEEFSGIAQWNNRIYLLPQYGSHKESKLSGDFNIYSLLADSVNRVINKSDSALTTYKTFKVLNLNKLPDTVKEYYQGFEAISIVNGRIFLSMETDDTSDYCFVLKGFIDTVGNCITIDFKNIISLKRPLYIKNAGFEALTYLPKQNKLLAVYEFNATAWRKTGYLIDTAFAGVPHATQLPFQYFRITDIATGPDNHLYALQYHYNGDYQQYLNNATLHHAEQDIKHKEPVLKNSLNQDPDFLKKHTYASIITMAGYKGRKWQTLTTMEGYKNNWEGILLFKRGALIITDANRNNKQVTILAYIEF